MSMWCKCGRSYQSWSPLLCLFSLIIIIIAWELLRRSHLGIYFPTPPLIGKTSTSKYAHLNTSELSTGPLFLDPTRLGETLTRPDPTRPAIADKKSDPTRLAARPSPICTFFNWIHLNGTSKKAGAAAEQAANLKIEKYRELIPKYLFVPVAVETLGPINEEGANFLCDLGSRIEKITQDRLEKCHIFQRISVAV